MAQPLSPSLTRSIPLLGAAAAGGLVALAFVALPGAWLEGAVEGSGVAALLPVAAPPLGLTARAVLALMGGVLVAAIAWAALYLLFGPGGPFAATVRRSDAPTLRRADAHPDAPPRWPLSASELSVPELTVTPPPIEQPLPDDLDAPLAAFDPGAVLPVPREPVRPVKPLAPPPALEPGERLDVFALTLPPAPVRDVEERPSIEALLRRLEQGAQRRVAGAR